jgi:hypothetical protein
LKASEEPAGNPCERKKGTKFPSGIWGETSNSSVIDDLIGPIPSSYSQPPCTPLTAIGNLFPH